MHWRHLPALAVFVASARAQAGRARARTVALLVLASMLGIGCRTPWSIEPLPFEALQTGMRPDAVRHVLGEPERIGTSHEATFPESWPRLRAGADIHPPQAWHYEDEKVDPLGLTLVGLTLPVSLPLHLLGAALRLDESERDCMWTEQREIDLYFEDERLVEWVVTAKPEPDWCTPGPNWQPPPSFWEATFGSGWPGNRRRGGC